MHVSFDSNNHHRRSIRLKDYDYSQAGAYYVTICTQTRGLILGDVAGDVRLNDAGRMVEAIWQEIPVVYPGVELDQFIVMPDHLHGIVVLVDSGQPRGVAPTLALGEVVGRFKSLTTNEYIKGVHEDGWPPFRQKLWQRNYFEHVIRNEEDLDEIREYISTNPTRWMIKRNLL